MKHHRTTYLSLLIMCIVPAFFPWFSGMGDIGEPAAYLILKSILWYAAIAFAVLAGAAERAYPTRVAASLTLALVYVLHPFALSLFLSYDKVLEREVVQWIATESCKYPTAAYFTAVAFAVCLFMYSVASCIRQRQRAKAEANR